jgi:hypothetical protein
MNVLWIIAKLLLILTRTSLSNNEHLSDAYWKEMDDLEEKINARK